MPLWKSSNSGSSSPASGGRDMRNPPQKPRLQRQRKLRHLSDEDLGELVAAALEAGEANPIARSHSSLENIHPRPSVSMSVPQPLPLPEAGAARRHPQVARGDAEEGNGHAELSSHKVEPVGERFFPPVVMGSWLAQPNTRRSPEHGDVLLAGSKYGLPKNGFQDPHTFEDNHSRLTPPERSGATSVLSSPGMSPGRLSNGDAFPSAYAAPHILQMWSAPELPLSDLTVDFSPTPMEKYFTGDRSTYSPKVISPGPKSRNPSAPCSPLHLKMHTETSPVRHDNHGNANVHPLPLPPGAPLLLQPSFSQPSTKANQWQKGKLIGCGTFGNVYIATNRHTGALCAMKEVNLIPDDPKSAECIKQLQQEIKLLGRLKHPNIVQYYGSEIIEDRFYIYLEYVYPGSINRYVNEHCGAVTESVIRNFTRHILKGLAYLHGTKTMHRDIKGANLLVDSCGVVKLADFGMAKHLTGAKDVLSMKGTPYWMAPEVLQATMNKELSYDFAIDIWSLGCTIIEMFTGKHPWSGFESAAAMFKVLHESPRIPQTLSAEGKDFLQRCFRRNPNERPAASKLLDHPFVTHTVQHDLHGSMQPFSGMRFSDVSHGPNMKLLGDLTVKGKYSFNGKPSQPPLGTSDHQPLSALQL